VTDALVGHTGFVGSNLLAQRGFDRLYNSKNMRDIRGARLGLLVFAGAQAKKWWANQNPEADRAGIEDALGHLRHVSAKRVVLISTVDVLPSVDGLTEDFDAASAKTHPYGENRLHLEVALRQTFETVHVIRLPALFGQGLKKNVIYDLLHDNLLDKINPHSAFQYYDLTRLWQDLELVMARGIPLIHLFPQPIATSRIVDECFAGKPIGADPSPAARYDFRTRHDALFGRSDGYVASADDVMQRLRAFVAAARG
jgi:hypothetical protein